MKKMKKIFALLIAMVMVMGMSSAVFAAPGDFSQVPEGTITVKDVTAGDTVQYFQLVKYDPTAEGGWVLTELGASCGVTLANLLDGITSTEGATIASNVTSGGTAMSATTADPTTFEAEVDPGLYYIKVTPAASNKNTLYNPAFVSADYYEGGNLVSMLDKFADETVVKKSTLTVDKVPGSNLQYDVKVGDVISFKVTTKLPSYIVNDTNPTFTITDTMDPGLTLSKADGTTPAAASDISITFTNDVAAAAGTPVTASDYTVTPSATGFTIEFDSDYLKTQNRGTPDIEIIYYAKVTVEPQYTVDLLNNKATATFDDVEVEDKTHHYTFSLGADLIGSEFEQSRELVKFGVDANDDPIMAYKYGEIEEKEADLNKLAGAEFALYAESSYDAATQKIKDGETPLLTATSANDGLISFYGLDAGTYYLTETKAPAGFIKSEAVVPVVITPTYTTDEEGNQILASVKITVNGNESNYTVGHNGDTINLIDIEPDDGTVTPIENPQGVELPSTGGIGTTIFYIVGAILVLGAGVVLVTRRRMNVQ